MNNYFFSNEINEHGDETGNKKIYDGVQSFLDDVCKGECEQIKSVLEKMKPGDFDVVYFNDKIYEIDCLSEEDGEKLKNEEKDATVKHSVDVYKVTDGETDGFYFGLDDLINRMEIIGFTPNEIENVVSEVTKNGETTIKLEDGISVDLRKLTEDEISELRKDPEFEVLYKTGCNVMTESADSDGNEIVSSFKYRGNDVEVKRNKNGRFFYEISRNGRFLVNGSFLMEQETAEQEAKNSIDNAETFQFLNDEGEYEHFADQISESVEKNSKKQFKIEEANGEFSCVLSNGETKKSQNFRSEEAAKRFGEFCCEEMCESSGNGMYTVEFDDSKADCVKKSINDNPFLKYNVKFIDSNVIAVEATDDEDEIISEIKECLKECGLKEDDYKIVKHDQIWK